MPINSYGSLKQPPIHPDKTTHYYDESRQHSIEQVVETMPLVDQDFMYEERKKTQQVERLLSAYLKLIRKFDFMPKSILLETFQSAVKHVFASNKKEEAEQVFKEKICEKAEKICNNLQEEN